MPDTRTPHEKIADRLAIAAVPGTVYDQLVRDDQRNSYANPHRLNMRAHREYNQLNLED